MILQHFPIATRDLLLKVFSSNIKNYSAKYHIGSIFNEDTHLPNLGCFPGVHILSKIQKLFQNIITPKMHK